jgi:hypothetical protein
MSQLNRRSVLSAAAALPVAAVPAVALGMATDADPIFAAIQRYRDASASFAALFEMDLEDDDPRKAVAMDATSATADALLEIRPTTVEGVAALLRFAYEHEKGNHGVWPDGYVDDDGDDGRFGYSWSFMLHKHLAIALEAILAPCMA